MSTRRGIKFWLAALIIGLLTIALVGCGGGSLFNGGTGGSGGNGGGGGGNPNPVPTITNIVPATITAGSAAQTLQVNGTNFIASSTVSVGANARTTTYVSPTQVTVALTATDLATAGVYNITVTNPTPGGGASNSVTLTIQSTSGGGGGAAQPTIVSISPPSLPVGSPAQALVITGNNFSSSSNVNVNGSTRASTYSGGSLTIQLTTQDLASQGTLAISVTNPGPPSETSNVLNFTVTSALRVNSLMPPFVPLGTASITVVLGTTGYQQGTTNVYFNGLVQTANFNSTTNQLSITLSGSQLATAGAYPIYLSNGPGTQSNAMYFSVGSPSSSNGGLAVLAEQVSGQTVDVAYVPLPPLPTDPAGSGGYVAIVQLDTLDPMPFLPINGFISNTSAFVLPGDSSHTPTFLYDGGIGYNAVLKTLAMPAGFVPTMTAADPGDNLVLVASSTSGKVQLINSPAHTLAAVYTITTAGSLTFSGGDQCTGLCNLVVDHSGQAGRAIAVASTPTGYLSFTPTTGAIVQTYVSSPIGEVFAYDSTPTNWGAITPYYLSNGMSGAQYVDLHNAGAAVPINNLVGFRPDSAAVDNWTQLAVMPDEGSGVNYVVNFFGLPSTLPASLSLPGTSFTIPGGTYCDLRPDWTLTSIEPNTHILLSGQEFSNCIAATQLPPAPIADANGNPVSPAAPTQIRFGRVSAPQPDPGQDPKGYLLTPPWGNFSFTGLDPDGHAWQNSGDPHLFTTFTSVLTGKPTTLVVEDTSGLNGIWMAELPMNDFVNFTTGLVGAVSSLGEVSPKDMGTLATYIRVANPAPVITNLEPVQVPHRAFSASVAVLGAGFVSDGFFPASYIVFNNELKPYPFTQWASENEIFFDLTQADLSLPIATYPVYVQNPPPLDANGARGTAPAGMTSATFNLQIVYAQPTIASISPGQVLHATAVTITVVGTGYESTGPSGGTQVFFNGGPKTPTVSSDGTYLTFTLTATDAPLAGNYTIELVNPAPGGGSISGVLVVQ